MAFMAAPDFSAASLSIPCACTVMSRDRNGPKRSE